MVIGGGGGGVGGGGGLGFYLKIFWFLICKKKNKMAHEWY